MGNSRIKILPVPDPPSPLVPDGTKVNHCGVLLLAGNMYWEPRISLTLVLMRLKLACFGPVRKINLASVHLLIASSDYNNSYDPCDKHRYYVGRIWNDMRVCALRIRIREA